MKTTIPALLLLCCLGCGSGSSSGSTPTGNSRAAFEDAIQKAGGDYNKLSPTYQKMADSASRGHGPQYVFKNFQTQSLVK